MTRLHNLPPAAIAADRAARIIGYGRRDGDSGFDFCAVSWLTERGRGYSVATWTEKGGGTLAAVRPSAIGGPFGECDGTIAAQGATPRDAIVRLVIAVHERDAREVTP